MILGQRCVFLDGGAFRAWNGGGRFGAFVRGGSSGRVTAPDFCASSFCMKSADTIALLMASMMALAELETVWETPLPISLTTLFTPS